MSIFIVKGCYTAEAAKQMLAKPSNREDAVRPLIEAVGGKILSYYVTFGDHDFQLIVEGGNAKDMMAALLVVGSSGIVCNMSTTEAVTAADFMETQTRAAKIVASYTAPGK